MQSQICFCGKDTDAVAAATEDKLRKLDLELKQQLKLNANLENELANCKKQLTVVSNDSNTALEKQQVQQYKIKDLTLQIQQYDHDLSTLDVELAKSQIEAAGLSDKLDAKNQEVLKMTEIIKGLKQEKKSKDEDFNKEKFKLQSNNQELRNLYIKFNSHNLQLQAALLQQQKNYDEVVTERNAAINKRIEVEKQLEDAQYETIKNAISIKALERELEANNGQITSLKKTVSDHEKIDVSQKAIIQEQKDKIKELEAEIRYMKNRDTRDSSPNIQRQRGNTSYKDFLQINDDLMQKKESQL